jgi:hypothetical protein
MCNYKKLIRDINVKLQERKYNFKEFKGVFCKITTPSDFSNFLELFFYSKRHGSVYGAVDQIHRWRSMSLQIILKTSR